MEKLILFLICSLIVFQPVFGQHDFRDGFIVTTKRDTIRVKVDYRSATKGLDFCRTNDGLDIKEYRPEELLGYGFINDRHFESGVVSGYFAEALVRGALSLYKHGLAFYAKKGDAIYALEERVVRVQNGSSAGLRKDERWKGVLAFLVSDCRAANDGLRNLRLAERPITEFVVKYNSCIGSAAVVYKALQQWAKVEAGIMLGMVHSTLTIDKRLNNLYLKENYYSFDPTIGVLMAVSSPRVSEKIAFGMEVHFSSTSYSSMLESTGPLESRYDDTYINVTTITVPVMVRYSLPKRRYLAHFNLGFNFDHHFKASAKVLSERVTDGVVDSFESIPFQINRNSPGFLAGAILVKSFPKFNSGVVLRYVASGFSGVDELTVRNRRLSISLILQTK